jgi:phage head maturation protease
MQPDVYRFLEIKEVGEDGTFTGIASVYGVEDLGGDVIEKGAFKKTIEENPEVVILWQHDADEVIGKGRVVEQGNKIMLEATLDMVRTQQQGPRTSPAPRALLPPTA